MIPSASTASVLCTPSGPALREQLQLLSGQLMTVLIGKDGGEKLRRPTRVDVAEILGLIDSMPMRYQEMRRRGGT